MSDASGSALVPAEGSFVGEPTAGLSLDLAGSEVAAVTFPEVAAADCGVADAVMTARHKKEDTRASLDQPLRARAFPMFLNKRFSPFNFKVFKRGVHLIESKKNVSGLRSTRESKASPLTQC